MALDIVFLHGFLGQGSDWDRFFNGLGLREEVETAWAPDLFSPESSFKVNEFPEWVSEFHESLHLRLNPNNTKVLIGYSLGGRLALEYLKKHDFFDAAIFISSQIEPLGSEDIENRMKFDEYWADKFLNQEWAPLVKEWDRLSVFGDSQQAFDRYEEDYSRKALAAAFDLWSPTLQKGSINDLRLSLSKILFVAGQEDEKYCDQYLRLLSTNRNANVSIIDKMGHRFLKDPSLEIIVQVSDFINSL